MRSLSPFLLKAIAQVKLLLKLHKKLSSFTGSHGVLDDIGEQNHERSCEESLHFNVYFVFFTDLSDEHLHFTDRKKGVCRFNRPLH